MAAQCGCFFNIDSYDIVVVTQICYRCKQEIKSLLNKDRIKNNNYLKILISSP